MASSKDTAQVMERFRTHGYTFVMGGQGHWKVYEGSRLVTTLSGTPSDRRARIAAETALRRDMRQRSAPVPHPEITETPPEEEITDAEYAPLRKEARRAIMEQIRAREERIANRQAKQRPKSQKRAPKQLPERVRLKSKGTTVAPGVRRVTGPDGKAMVYATNVIEGGTIRRDQVVPDDVEAESCFSCFREGTRWVRMVKGEQVEYDLRNVCLALGLSLRDATRMAQIMAAEAAHAASSRGVMFYLCEDCFSRLVNSTMLLPDLTDITEVRAALKSLKSAA